jgi:hypothetical protein
MEPEGSLPHSQVPATFLYPKPAQSVRYLHIPLTEDKWTCPIQAPNIPGTKSHAPLSLLRSYHSISPCPRLCLWIFRNKDSFSEWVVSPSPKPYAGEPPRVGYPRLFIQYIRSYLPHWRPFLHPQPDEAPCRCDRDPLIIWLVSLLVFRNILVLLCHVYCDAFGICPGQTPFLYLTYSLTPWSRVLLEKLTSFRS